jgi:hypothetical protein
VGESLALEKICSERDAQKLAASTGPDGAFEMTGFVKDSMWGLSKISVLRVPDTSCESRSSGYWPFLVPVGRASFSCFC